MLLKDKDGRLTATKNDGTPSTSLSSILENLAVSSSSSSSEWLQQLSSPSSVYNSKPLIDKRIEEFKALSTHDHSKHFSSNPGYQCFVCNETAYHLRYRTSHPYISVLCSDCFKNGYFPSSMRSEDFVRVEGIRKTTLTAPSSNDEQQHPWSASELLMLVEAIEMYDEDWQRIASYVGGRSRSECLMQFLKLPIATNMTARLMDREEEARVKEALSSSAAATANSTLTTGGAGISLSTTTTTTKTVSAASGKSAVTSNDGDIVSSTTKRASPSPFSSSFDGRLMGNFEDEELFGGFHSNSAFDGLTPLDGMDIVKEEVVVQKDEKEGGGEGGKMLAEDEDSVTGEKRSHPNRKDGVASTSSAAVGRGQSTMEQELWLSLMNDARSLVDIPQSPKPVKDNGDERGDEVEVEAGQQMDYEVAATSNNNNNNENDNMMDTTASIIQNDTLLQQTKKASTTATTLSSSSSSSSSTTDRMDDLYSLFECSENPVMAYIAFLARYLNPAFASAASRAVLHYIFLDEESVRGEEDCDTAKASSSSTTPTPTTTTTMKKEHDFDYPFLLRKAVAMSQQEAHMCAMSEDTKVKNKVVEMTDLVLKKVEAKLNILGGLGQDSAKRDEEMYDALFSSE